jgi:two-component system sensor histidine kinase DesK
MLPIVLTDLVPAFLRPAPDSMVARVRRAGSKPWVQLFNVMWSVWVFLTPIFTPVDPSFWWSVAISYPVFLVLFVLVHVRPYAENAIYSSLLAVLACVSMPWNSAAWTYGVFACVYVPYAGSLRASMSKIVLIQLAMLVVVVWQQWPWFVAVLLVGICTSSGFGSLMGHINMARNAEQRLSHDEVRRLAAVAERERIGRDLHDLLGHTLSLIALKLELSRKLFDRDPAAARRELSEAENVARHALSQVRTAVTGIRAAGLAAELASARLLLQASGVQFDYHQQVADLPVGIERMLALVLREAVTNIHRHAHAGHAEAVIERDGDSVCLRISDNGRGGDIHCGNGLDGMRERVQSLGGTLEIEAPAGKGCRIRVRVPSRDASSSASAASVPGQLARGRA